MLSQSERHTITSTVLNQLIGAGIVPPARRTEGYRRVRKILLASGAKDAATLLAAIHRTVEARKPDYDPLLEGSR